MTIAGPEAMESYDDEKPDIISNHRSIAVPANDGQHTIEFMYTVPYMEQRKTRRRWRGAYVKSRPFLNFILLLIIILLLTFSHLQYDDCT